MFRKLFLMATSLIAATVMVAPVAASASASPGLTVAQGSTSPGVAVRLYAWPPSADHVRPGAKVPLVVLATTTASSSGSYVLRASGRALAAATGPQGNVNLEAQAGSRTWFFIRHVAADRISATPESPASPATVNLPGAGVDSCITYYQGQLPPSWAQVGQLYILSPATHVTGDFTYSTGQSSSLGVGISASGAAGSYQLDGTVSQSKQRGAGFPPIYAGTKAWDRTKFRVAQYKQVCHAGGLLSIDHIVRSNGYAGGESMLHPRTAPVAHACEPYLKGGAFYSSDEEAVTWSGGFTIPAVSFNASAQTGYDSSAEIAYHFNASHRYACGTRGQQPGYARQVVAEK
jgi:hypothetical protein